MWIWKTQNRPIFVIAKQFGVSRTHFASIWKPYMRGQRTGEENTGGLKGGSIDNRIFQNAGKPEGWLV